MSLFNTTTAQAADIKSQPKVVVIGAGLAGLTAAYRLQQQGFPVDIYEARPRVGGRVFTVQSKGLSAELGGHNIADGCKALHIHRLINEFGLQCDTSHVKLNIIHYDGKQLIPVAEYFKTLNYDREELHTYLQGLASRSHTMKEILDQFIDASDPLYDHLAVRLAAYEGATIDQLSSIYVETLYHILLGGISVANPGSGTDDNFVELTTVEGGNSTLPEKMASLLNVHLNMPLTKVSTGKEGGYELAFADGQKTECAILILAIPCTTYGRIEFEDSAIPADRLQAIRSVGYGTNGKIMIPFINSPTARISITSKQIASFLDAGHQMFTLYFTGEASHFTKDTLEGSYRIARPMIEDGFGEFCPPFETPQYAENKNFSSYHAPVGYSWPNDPYAGGSYSFITAGQEKLLTETTEVRGVSHKSLFAPIQNLYFAGEHASLLFDVPGTMEAACESGERTAQAIKAACD